MNVEKLFGVSADTFPDVPGALAWLKDRVFAPKGLAFDERAISEAAQAAVATASGIQRRPA